MRGAAATRWPSPTRIFAGGEFDEEAVACVKVLTSATALQATSTLKRLEW